MTPTSASWRRAAGAGALAVVLAAGAAWLAAEAAARLPAPRPLEELSYYPSGRHLRAATLGHAESAADLAWLRAVQYYGERRRTDNRFDRLYHVFDVLTTLAPGFVPAYVFGAFALAQEGSDFARAQMLMEKGLAANPASGRLAFEAGFLHFVRPGGRDLPAAARYFEQASRQADAPPQARRFAAFVRQHAGDLRLALELWQDVAARSPNPYLRDMAEREIGRIRAALATGDEGLARRPLSRPEVRLEPGP